MDERADGAAMDRTLRARPLASKSEFPFIFCLGSGFSTGFLAQKSGGRFSLLVIVSLCSHTFNSSAGGWRAHDAAR
jgi:hypothetical protein